MTLSFFGLAPPCSRHGCKTGYASAIRRELGVQKFDRYLLSDVDGGLVRAMSDLCHRPQQLAREVAELSRRGSDANECWKLAREEREGSTAAWWIWCAGAFRGVGNWRGEHSRRPNSDGFSPSREELARRIATRPVLKKVDLALATAEEIGGHLASPNWFANDEVYAYLDPPYHNTAEYPHSSAFNLKRVVENFQKSCAKVVVSESRPLYWGPNAKHVDVTEERVGQSRKDSVDKNEWLTILEGNQR